MKLRPWPLAVGLALLAAACNPFASGDDVPDLVAAFDWEMAPRFGLDGDGDGRIDVPNSEEYVRGLDPGACPGGCAGRMAAFQVTLDATSSRSDSAAIDSYRWEVAAAGSEVVRTLQGPRVDVSMAEGDHEVVLTVGRGADTASVTGTVAVRDHLIVVLGDSYASGEGNPESNFVTGGAFFDEVVGLWADDGGADPDAVVAFDHRRAHRSTLAAGAQAALELELADPRSSVTLVFLASSGAAIESGILGPHGGVVYELPEGGEVAPDLAPQLEELAGLLGCGGAAGPPACDRVVDALVVSVGGNDIGFGAIWGGLVALDPLLDVGGAYDRLVEEVLVSAQERIDRLPDLFEQLAAGVAAAVETEVVLVTAYPSATTTVADGRVVTCPEVAALLPGLEIDAAELDLADERVIDPLNDAIAAAAADHGWVFVDGHLEAFQGHGMCGTAPYPPEDYPGNPYPAFVSVPDDPAVRWFRQAEESAAIQGTPDQDFFRPENLATRGTLHPNEYGHQVIKAALVAELVDLLS